MQSSLGSTMSKVFFVVSVILLAWTTVARGAAIGAGRARINIVDVATDGLLRRVDAPMDDAWYTLAASKEALAERDGDLSRRVDVPVDNTAGYTANELSTPTERDLSRRRGTEARDAWYALAETEIGSGVSQEVNSRRSGKMKQDDPASRVDLPANDRDLWYALSVDSESESEP